MPISIASPGKERKKIGGSKKKTTKQPSYFSESCQPDWSRPPRAFIYLFITGGYKPSSAGVRARGRPAARCEEGARPLSPSSPTDALHRAMPAIPAAATHPSHPGGGWRCPTWRWHHGRPLVERSPLSPRPQARGRWATGDAPTLGLSSPLLFLISLLYINIKKSPIACCKSLSRCQRHAGPRPPSPPPSRRPAQTSPHHGQDLSLLDHPEHYWGLKVASSRRARPPPSHSLTSGCEQDVGGRVPFPQASGAWGQGVSCTLPAPFPDGLPALFRAPKAMAGPRLRTAPDPAAVPAKARPRRAGLPIIQ